MVCERRLSCRCAGLCLVANREHSAAACGSNGRGTSGGEKGCYKISKGDVAIRVVAWYAKVGPVAVMPDCVWLRTGSTVQPPVVVMGGVGVGVNRGVIRLVKGMLSLKLSHGMRK